MLKSLNLLICNYSSYYQLLNKSTVASKLLSPDLKSFKELTNELKLNIESKWNSSVSKGTFNAKNENSDKKYILSMFPYPSGNLHMGHVRVYTIGDTIARYFRLNEKNVFHPIGFDAFGLPAENAALERHIPAVEWTWSNIKAMRHQLKKLSLSFDWDHEVITCDSKYYKFTQYLFLLMFKENLVYQNEALVNWDPLDKTVLADEQVDENGRSWRSGAVVQKKLLKQWYIETTRFAHALKKELKNPILLSDWRDISSLQDHWIGECNGYSFYFTLLKDKSVLRNIKIWTKYPEFITDAAFVAVKPNSHLDLVFGPSKERLNIDLINPLNKETLPVFVVENINYDEGCDIKLVIPHIDSDCKEIAEKYSLKWQSRVSAENKVERNKICELALEANIGGYITSSKLKDWLISRQRKWGTPIPLIHCDTCGVVPVPYNELPVVLPAADSFEQWLLTDCPQCSKPALRERDTMDTFVDSSWYFLRYLDPDNDCEPFHSKLAEHMMPVDIYVGGKEHAVLHLYYARFVAHFLHSVGMLKEPEPFKKLLVQGMVMGRTYKVKDTNKYISKENVKELNGSLIEEKTGEKVKVSWEKMSKSKYNGIEPNEVLEKYGIDTSRLFILSEVSPTSHKYWKDDNFPGVINWQKRIWSLMIDFLEMRKSNNFTLSSEKIEEELWDARNYYTKVVTFNYEVSHQLSVAISKLQGLTNSLKKCPSGAVGGSVEFEKGLAALIIMLAPMAPHFASELWELFQKAPARLQTSTCPIKWDKPLFHQAWPRLDSNYNLPLFFAVNNAVKDTVKLLVCDLNNLLLETATDMALNNKKVKEFIGNKDILSTKLNIVPNFEAKINIEINYVPKAKLLDNTKL